ncbi:MAG: hypothetical protein QF464_11195 [Myxococcota bacterium]|nr:hypothetical protein [Myxococcota bacterium]
MHPDALTRRDFTKLTMAAFAGAAIGCGKGGGAPVPVSNSGLLKDVPPESLLLQEPHVCRGLNACKGTARDGKNACAGQGSCATAQAHGCGGRNACKGLGGCGDTPGQNACKGQGKCGVPITMDPAWDKVRKALEALAKPHGIELGPAPKRG